MRYHGNELDNEIVYPNTAIQVFTLTRNPYSGNLYNLINLDDAPRDGWRSSFNLSGTFVDYVMFAPSQPGSIFVPLGNVTWGTTFGASYPSTNISPNSVVGPTNPNDSEGWPIWTNVFSNPNN